MRAAAQKANVSIVVVSGFRTMDRQRELYADYKEGRGHLAAVPGFSNHQSGQALDLAVQAPKVRAWLESHAADFGFRRTVPTEPWHWEHN
jgi:LAS superfamily LD-carboxypeptidase LdcB